MAKNKFYPSLKLSIDGKFQAEWQNVSIDWDPALQRLETVPGGVSGYSEGGAVVTVSGTQAIPPGGPEFNPVQAMSKKEVHQLSILAGGPSYSGNGVFMKATVTQSVNGAPQIEWTWEGQFDNLE